MFTPETEKLGGNISVIASVEEENCKRLQKEELVFLVGQMLSVVQSNGHHAKRLSRVGPAASLGRNDSRLSQEEVGQEGLSLFLLCESIIPADGSPDAQVS